MKKVFLSGILSLLLSTWAVGQSTLQVFKTELSVPFGKVPGSLITIGDHLIFIDDDHPEASFTVARTDLQNLSVADGIVTVQTAKPVRDRSGERTALSFRLREDTRSVGITSWYGGGTIRTQTGS